MRATGERIVSTGNLTVSTTRQLAINQIFVIIQEPG